MMVEAATDEICAEQVKKVVDVIKAQGPVSYTHLDVYKRQVYGFPENGGAVQYPE